MAHPSDSDINQTRKKQSKITLMKLVHFVAIKSLQLRVKCAYTYVVAYDILDQVRS
jgi:hypothetical protein